MTHHETRTASIQADNGEYGIQRVCMNDECDWTGTEFGWRNIDGRHIAQREGAEHEKATYAAAAEALLREREAAEDEQAHANGDPCANPDCEDCHPYDGGMENASEDRLIEWARGEY